MAGSQAERDIRDAVVDHLRASLPGARIVHELVVGQCRADIAAIEPECLTLVEIKSKKDTLDRLKRQVEEFEPACHRFIVVADQRWFEEFDYRNGQGRGYRPGDGLDCVPIGSAWRWPKAERGQFLYDWGWQLPRRTEWEPHAAKLLALLWKYELIAEAGKHGVAANTRSTIGTLIRDMTWMMTGREIAHAVCRQLRARHFPEADAPILESKAA